MMTGPIESSLPVQLGSGPNRLDPVFVEAEAHIAWESPDHVPPWGTAHDNSRNARFSAKAVPALRGLGSFKSRPSPGCAGGGFVRECIDDGWSAGGVEGSDYSSRMARAEWVVLGACIVSNAKIEATGRQPDWPLDDGSRELLNGHQMIRNLRYSNV